MLDIRVYVAGAADRYARAPPDAAASYYNSSLIFNFQCISLRAFSLFAPTSLFFSCLPQTSGIPVRGRARGMGLHSHVAFSLLYINSWIVYFGSAKVVKQKKKINKNDQNKWKLRTTNFCKQEKKKTQKQETLKKTERNM